MQPSDGNCPTVRFKPVTEYKEYAKQNHRQWSHAGVCVLLSVTGYKKPVAKQAMLTNGSECIAPLRFRAHSTHSQLTVRVTIIQIIAIVEIGELFQT